VRGGGVVAPAAFPAAFPAVYSPVRYVLHMFDHMQYISYICTAYDHIYIILEVTIARKVLPHPQGIKGSIRNLMNKGLFSLYDPLFQDEM
jgi:hypothetical protein